MPIWRQDPALLLSISNSVSWGRWWSRGRLPRTGGLGITKLGCSWGVGHSQGLVCLGARDGGTFCCRADLGLSHVSRSQAGKANVEGLAKEGEIWQ